MWKICVRDQHLKRKGGIGLRKHHVYQGEPCAYHPGGKRCSSVYIVGELREWGEGQSGKWLDLYSSTPFSQENASCLRRLGCWSSHILLAFWLSFKGWDVLSTAGLAKLFLEGESVWLIILCTRNVYKATNNSLTAASFFKIFFLR